MVLSVYNTELPVSILFTVFGFSTSKFGNKYINVLQYTYCIIITALMVILDVMAHIFKLCNIEATLVSVIYLVWGVASTTTLTYYRLKFLTDGNITTDIIKNLNYVDEHLYSVGAKASHVKDLIICYAYIALSSANRDVYKRQAVENTKVEANMATGRKVSSSK